MGSSLISKFMKRKNEIDELEKLIDKIKAYIKDNKAKLINNNSEMEKRIFEIQVQNNPKLRSTIEGKVEKGAIQRGSF